MRVQRDYTRASRVFVSDCAALIFCLALFSARHRRRHIIAVPDSTRVLFFTDARRRTRRSGGCAAPMAGFTVRSAR